MSLSPRSLQRQMPLQEQIYHALHSAIVSGELAPGERLVETRLAQQLQVSRTPIREAIRLLRHAHLAITDPGGATCVATLSVQDASELYDCRIALESLSVREACQNASADQLQALEALLLQAEKWSGAESLHLSHFHLLNLDHQFHHTLAQCSGNTCLIALLDHVFDRMQLLRIQTLKRNPQVLEVRLEHRCIFEAVEKRDPEKAVKALCDHLRASKVRVIHEVAQLYASPREQIT